MAEPGAQLRRPVGGSGPQRDPARDAQILQAATELLIEGGYPALSMDKAASRAGVGKATVYRRWQSRAELAAEALGQAGLADDVVPVVFGPGRLREELISTLMPTAGGPEVSPVGLVAALLDTSRQEPQLCALVRERYVDSLHRALGCVVEQAVLRGDLPPQEASAPGGRSVAVSAAIALLIHWSVVHDRPLGEGDITQIVDGVLVPLLGGRA